MNKLRASKAVKTSVKNVRMVLLKKKKRCWKLENKKIALFTNLLGIGFWNEEEEVNNKL